ncbi:MAG: FtsK/SpoIIIE domain-containing protein [Rhodoluna sp.]
MRIIAFLPALVIALLMAWLTGMWQFALFALLSLVSGYVTSVVVRKRKKEPDLDYSDQPVWLHPMAVAIGDQLLPKTGLFLREHLSDYIFDYLTREVANREVAKKGIELAAKYYKSKMTGALPFWCGVSENSDLEFDLARDGPHALIVGATGAGKSELLKLITCSLMSSGDSSKVRLVLIDFKGGAALRQVARHPSTLVLITDLEPASHERFWLYLQGELLLREQKLAALRKSSIAETDMPRLLVIADELPAILSSVPVALTALEAIAARGRSLGVHLIATSQSLSGIPRSLLTNLPLRFALGITDPGDLVALVPSVRSVVLGQSRAIAVSGVKVVPFEFPVTNILPDMDKPKFDSAASAEWSFGLGNTFLADYSILGQFEDPLQHRLVTVGWNELSHQSVLVVGGSRSGKTTFCKRASFDFNIVLDCPSQSELEVALATGQKVACAISSSTILPLALQRRFETVIYLRQGNLEQHISAGLPRNQWNQDLPPGRCWFQGKQMQLAMKEPTPEESVQENAQSLPAH